MTVTRIPFQTEARTSAVAMVTEYGQQALIKLQVYPGRPRSLFPPTAFVDRIRERLLHYTLNTRQRIVSVEMVIVHGLFDSAEAATQKDEFVDGFIEWVSNRAHGFGPDTLVAVVATEDIPNYIPDWLPPEQQRTYYATRLTLEGLAAT